MVLTCSRRIINRIIISGHSLVQLSIITNTKISRIWSSRIIRWCNIVLLPILYVILCWSFKVISCCNIERSFIISPTTFTRWINVVILNIKKFAVEWMHISLSCFRHKSTSLFDDTFRCKATIRHKMLRCHVATRIWSESSFLFEFIMTHSCRSNFYTTKLLKSSNLIAFIIMENV